MNKHRFIFAVIALVFAFANSFAQFTNVAVSTNADDQSEPATASSPLNPSLLIGAWNDFRSDYFSQAGYAFSTNGGTSWSEGIVPAPTGRPTYIYGFDPSAVFDRYGNAFYCYIASDDIRLGATYVARSTNQGTTWDVIKQVSAGALDQDKPYIAVDNTGGTRDGRIYVSWTDFSSGSAIKFAYSTDHGVSFSTPITLGSQAPDPGPFARFKPSSSNNPGSPTSVFVQGSIPAVGPNGELYVVWMDVNFGYNAATYKIRKSTDGGTTFGSAITVAQFSWIRTALGKLDILNFPSLSVDPISGYVYASFMDQVSQTNPDLRVKWVRSTNGGSTWSSPTTIAGLGSGWQFFPWVTVDQTGRISVAFMHSGDLSLVDSYVIESYDRGVTFGSALRVSGTSSDPENGAWTHHYLGVTSTVGYTRPIWTDYRNGNADIYTARVNRPPTSNAATATAGNGQRKLARESNGTYHQVFETNQEIWYARKTTTDTEWNNYQRLNSGTVSGNSSPSIAERGGKVYVA